jgi:hypothetical protein
LFEDDQLAVALAPDRKADRSFDQLRIADVLTLLVGDPIAAATGR